MKNITFSAEENLIQRARLVALAQHKSLNTAFRQWLQQYVAQAGSGVVEDELMSRLRHVRSSGPYTRDEMNERQPALTHPSGAKARIFIGSGKHD
jgi:hypothetical protein